MGFFDEPQGAAVFKHAVLSTYLRTWASKLGQFAPGSRVAYLDGYAGAGAYGDGTPASPTLALEVAKELDELRDIQCFFVENDQGLFTQLTEKVGASPASNRAHILFGDIDDHLPAILEQIGNAPLFAFLDPFGIGIPFRKLTENLLSRPRLVGGRRTAQTEVLVNFVHAGVYRNAGKLDLSTDNSAQQLSAKAIVKRVNANLDGTWWQDIWRETVLAPGQAGLAVAKIRDQYVRNVLAEVGSDWRCYSVPISDVWQGKPIYDLLLFTQHDQGYWFFNEAVSLGRKAFHNHCDPNSILIQQLFDPEDEWVTTIELNIKKLIDTGESVHLIKHTPEIYGQTLGYARGTHVRKAIKSLYRQGLTTTNGVGDPLHDMIVAPGKPKKNHTTSKTA